MRWRVRQYAGGVEPSSAVPPSGRWAGAGVGVALETGPVLAANLTPGGPASWVELRADMRVGEAIGALLRSNSLCVSSSSGDAFYVKVASQLPGAAASAGGGGDNAADASLYCITLADLLEAPRQMPLDCLLGSRADAEECKLYDELPEPYLGRGAGAELLSRLPWLVGLLVFLTVSSAILEYYDELLQRHLVIAFYLTALVGCGGNSGSQAASLVLQALATGELVASSADMTRVLQKELPVALGVAVVLSVGVAVRMLLFGSSGADALLISGAMLVTVIFSVVFGALAPLGLKRIGTDPAKVSGPLLSTAIDIAGVLLACLSAMILEMAGAFK